MKNLSLRASVNFVRADGGESEGLTTPRIPRFSMLGYTGGVIRQAWSREPIVIDLAGMTVPSVIPIVFGHDYALESVLGQGSRAPILSPISWHANARSNFVRNA